LKKRWHSSGKRDDRGNCTTPEIVVVGNKRGEEYRLATEKKRQRA